MFLLLDRMVFEMNDRKFANRLPYLLAFLFFLYTFIMDNYVKFALENLQPMSTYSAVFLGIPLYIILFLFSMKKPTALNLKFLNRVFITAGLLGALFLFLGVLYLPVFLFLGLTLVELTVDWLMVVVCLSIAGEDSIHGISIIGCGILAYLLSLLCNDSNALFACGLMAFCPLLGILFSPKDIERYFGNTYHGQTSDDFRITQPSTWLPLSNALFVSMIAMMAICGFAIDLGTVNLKLTAAGVATVILLLSLLIKSKVCANLDFLYRMSMICAIFGSALLCCTQSVSSYAPLFFQVAYIILYTEAMVIFGKLGRANPTAALPIACIAGILLLAGFLAGNYVASCIAFANPDIALGLSLMVVLFLIIYALFGMKNFDLIKTINGITAPQDAVVASTQDIELLCERTAQRYNLTSRETEVLGYLARGRNRKIIERELFISSNTVKTHVSHIYSKIGCHDQQELIDVVSKADDSL